jgi:glycine oxidase
MLAPVTEVHYGEESLLRLNLVSSDLYPAFIEELADETGRDVGYRRAGTMMVARDSDDNATLDDVYHYQRELGLEVQRLSGRDCRELMPALSPRTRGGIHVAGDHQVDNRALVEALIAACAKRGVTFVHDAGVAVELTKERAAGVRLRGGEVVAAGSVLLATGASASEIAGLERAGLPEVRPVKGQLIHLRGAPLFGGNVRGLDAYLVGRPDGRVVVGATVEEQGFDLRITAGALHDLLRAAYELIPGIVELEVVEATAGSRPATPDNAPVIGRSLLEGVFVASGHFRNGVLLTPVTAAAVAEIVLEGKVPDQVAPFSPERFSRQGSPA